VLAALQSVSGIVERRHTLPILANVLMRKNGPQLTTSDLEIQIRTTAELGGDAGDFTTTVGARKLIDILRTMPADQTVSLETQQAKLILKGGKSRFTLQTLPAEDFPLVQEAPGFGPAFSVPQKTLKTCWARCLCHGGAGHPLLPQRHPVRGRRQDAQPGGHRRPPPGCQRQLDVEVPKQEVILPRKTVLELQRLLRTPPARTSRSRCSSPPTRPSSALAAWSSSPSWSRASSPTTTASSPRTTRTRHPGPRAAAGQPAAHGHPDQRQVQGRAPVVRARHAAIASNNAEQEEAVDELDIDYGGDTIEIGFNVTYLIDVLANMSAGHGPHRAADGSADHLPGNDNFKYVVMPMRI
jgi:DNA polymerase-3 subunit beta